MKLLLIALAWMALVNVSTASAAPQWVEDRCSYHANRVLPALDFRERQAYIANCIADWTAGTPPPPKSSKKTNRNRY
jgi:hypothetical protein